MEQVKRYRKRPVVIEAIRWSGNNFADVKSFVGEFIVGYSAPYVQVRTMEGILAATVGDYIIKGIQGEFYPCKPDIFESTYEDEEGD